MPMDLTQVADYELHRSLPTEEIQPSLGPPVPLILISTTTWSCLRLLLKGKHPDHSMKEPAVAISFLAYPTHY